MNNEISLNTKIKAQLTHLKWATKRAVTKSITGTDVRPTMTSNPLLKWPRNFNCVCGSGKKFKKCCLNGLSSQVTIEDAKEINNKLDKYRV